MRLLVAVAGLLVAAAFGAVGAITLVTGKAPRHNPELYDDDLAVGWTCVGIAALAGFVASRSLRARAKERRWDADAARLGDQRAPRHGGVGVGGAWKPIAAAGAGIAVLAARFGDDLARHTDDLDAARGLRGVDASFGAPAPGARAMTEDEFFQDALEVGGALLDANDARELYALLQGADVSFAARIEVTETVERYVPLGDNRYELVAQRCVRQTTHGQGGAVISHEVAVDDAPPDKGAGESVTLTFLPRTTPADGPERTEVVIEHRRVPASGGALEVFTIRTEVEVVDTSVDELGTDFRVELRTTEAGRALAARSLRDGTRGALLRKLEAVAQGDPPLDFEVRVPMYAESTLVLTRDGLELSAPGATVLEVLGRARR